MPVEMWIILIAVISGILFLLSKKASKFNSSVFSIYESEITRASRAYGVPPEIITSVIIRESNGNPDAVGLAGEKGLMQLKDIAVRDAHQNGLTPRTAASFRPTENILDGTAFLALQKQRAGSWFDALRAYNKGFAASQEFKENGAGYARNVMQKAREFGYFG